MPFSLADNYIAVNYHYVEPDNSRFSGAHPCRAADFARQVEFLSQHYQLVSVGEMFEAARRQAPGKFCALTFDDGLQGQYDYAAAILKQAKAPATFFIITSVLQGRLPAAHRVHVLLSHFHAVELIQIFHVFLSDFYPDLMAQYRIDTETRLTQRRLHEDVAAANFKETLIILPEDIKARFLRYCFKKFGLDAEKISKEIFMSEKEIRTLLKNGWEIGSHTHNHYALDSLSLDNVAHDIKSSISVLKKLVGSAPAVFSYPHGRLQPGNREILIQAGFKYAVTIERRGLTAADDNFLIPRYDTTDIKSFSS